MEKFDLIENQLKLYQDEAIEYIYEFAKGLNKYYLPSEDGKQYKFPSEENLLFLAQKKVYPYIKDLKELNEEFLNRVNYYNNLNKEDSFFGLQFKLFENINALYSLIDLDEALIIEDNPQIKGCCINALKSLKTENILVDEMNYYEQIIEQIKNKANFYTLNFDKTCDDIYDEINDALIYTEDNMFDIRKVIAQYEILEQPIRIDLINEFPELITDNDIFLEIHTRYMNDKNKLKDLLMGSFESLGLYSFYLFNKLCTCPENKAYRSRCFVCFMSTLLVLIYLKKYIETSNGRYSSISDDKLKQIACLLQPYLRLENQNHNELANALLLLKVDSVELDIIKLVTEGLSNPQIAERLYQNKNKAQFIKNKLNIIYDKLASEDESFVGYKKNKREKLAQFYKNNK